MWMVFWAVLGIAAFIGLNVLVNHVHACIREEIEDADSFPVKLLWCIPFLITGAWKLFMFILMAVGAAFAVSAVSTNMKNKKH